ncbi:signal transduction histidine kinase [Herbaspirillum sp. Sphag1AN]|uniref:ATP-binding protein n=1 Tax=unclassified Herbaspirillum TaxID=2624150 RepID=UPI00160C67BA|nr:MULTISPECIES: ATP-binding protein [unclassified Herbaspirillum]MBB3213128.1 signal transduction histidine kinase [Herbaspirillum sp. Sphag1AN]MBB3246325.1 signal transduction histidine kinase [Herbaspirillum sp. Sphag64]
MTSEHDAVGGADFRLIFESVPGLFMVLLPDLTIAAASDAYLRATLADRAQVVGRHLFDVFPDNPGNEAADGVANLRSSLQRVIQSRVPDIMALQRYDVPLPDGDGFEERYWSPSNYPVLDQYGQLLYIIHRAEDVTDYALIKKERDELKRGVDQAEQEWSMQADDTAGGTRHLHALNRALKLEILARNKLEDDNSELTEQLKHNIEQLEASNKELESFSYSVSHDLRAPLRAIDGFARILEEDIADQLDVEARRKLQVIRDNVRNMGRLIEALLEYSRLGRKELSASPVDMTMIARTGFETVLAEFSKLHPTHNVNLHLDELPAAQGDVPLLRQVWFNLLANACKFSVNNPEASIWISGEQCEDRLIYRIRDNGAGFDMRYQTKLFGMFQRLHRLSEFEGIGAGLAIAQRILMRHGGQIEAQGIVGEGATFTFSLPLSMRSPA